ncbi:MAG: glycosyl transferase, partial [Alphaproteobacteria bacterium]|nr:glycosyl transferase [Alphaproteobacteria bacterium]
ILFTILQLVREERPFLFFGVIAALLTAIALAFGGSLLVEFIDTGLVPRLPTALLATGLVIIAFLSLMTGLILDTVTRGRWESKRMAYLALGGPQSRSQ